MEKKVMASAAPPLDTAFHLVNLWTLSNAFMFTFAFAFRLISTIMQTTTTYGVADVDAAMLWCSTPQVVAGALALLLPCHRRRLRRASAYAGLALTVASHCIVFPSVVHAIIVADDDPSGDVFFRVGGYAAVFPFAVCDLWCFLALVRGAGKN